MELNRGQSKIERGKNVEEGSGHGMAKVTRQANKAGKTRPLQANTAGGTGLEEKQQPEMLAGLSPCSAGWWRECGGAGHSKGRLGPTYLSPSHLSPLPVSVNTHSLNLQNPI